MNQTLALFVDAYRELNSQKLFWITLGLSALVASVFAMVGIDEQGVTFLYWHISNDFNSNLLAPATFYKLLFVILGIDIWLTWVATILGLIATAGIFPNFLTSGAVELVLSKPIGRVRLFLTKYITGLLFVTFQVSAFTFTCFLVIGFRGGVWEPGLLLAVPLVVLFFSYLFCVCCFLGVRSQSTVKALLLTLLFWAGVWFANARQEAVVVGRIRTEMQLEAIEKAIEAAPPELDVSAMKKTADTYREYRNAWYYVDLFAGGGRKFAPKTRDTIALLKRQLIDLADLPAPQNAQALEPQINNAGAVRIPRHNRELQRRVEAAMPKDSVGWVLGTSLAFEAVVLGFAAWLFWRRDF